MNFKTHFYTFLEARQEEIDKIRDAVNKVSDRPFNELFDGKGDRFLRKVWNPQFEKGFAQFGWTSNAYDINKKEINGRNYNTWFKQVKSFGQSKMQSTIDDILNQADIYASNYINKNNYNRNPNEMVWAIYDSSGKVFGNMKLDDATVDKMFERTNDLTVRNSYKFNIKDKNLVIQGLDAPKGLARKIYVNYLLNKYPFILSDSTMTPEGFGFWKKLWTEYKDQFMFYIYDSYNKTKTDLTDVNQMDEVFGPEKDKHQYKFVMVR